MATTHKVEIVPGMKFRPDPVTIVPGDTVEWTNRMGMVHTVTADDGRFDSGVMGGGQTFSETFAATGTVPYHCEIHPFMTGTVEVALGTAAYTPEVGRRFWFEFDQATLHSPAFMDSVRRAGAGTVQDAYRETRAEGAYPEAFVELFRPVRDHWVTIADLQTRMVGDLLGNDWAIVQAAFEDFGQGTLLDTDPQRVADGDAIHMMDGQVGNPPVGYHRWHASIRAIQLLGIGDAAWWEDLDRLVGLGWGIQSFATPVQGTTPNPALAPSDLQGLRDAWLPLTPERRDQQYDLTAEAFGFHPSPKAPAKGRTRTRGGGADPRALSRCGQWTR